MDSQVEEYEYEGKVMSKNNSPAWALDKIKETLLDDSDVVVSTYPKCGTTWMQEIVYLVNTEGDFEGSEKLPYRKKFNFIDINSGNPNLGVSRLEADPPPRLLITHLASNFFKKTLDNRKTKFVVVFRNPKDMLVSFFHFYKMNKNLRFDPDGSWEEFFERFKNDKLIYGSYFDTQLSWWAYRDDPRVKIFMFEEMLKDPEQAVRQVAAFLEKDLSDDVIHKIVQQTSFKSMKKNPNHNHSSQQHMSHNVSTFMRKGATGDWKNYFNDKQKEYVDMLSKSKFEAEQLFLAD